MFKKIYEEFMILESEERVDEMMKLAYNYQLSCVYKIGVYGKVRQHEIFLRGTKRDIRRFIKDVNAELEVPDFLK